VVTFPQDLTDPAEMDSTITDLTARTLAEVTAAGRTVTRVAVTVRTSSFFTRTKIRKLAGPGNDAAAITAAALALLGEFDRDRPVRLLGVRLELEMPPC
jgi:DNA polymerase-4